VKILFDQNISFRVISKLQTEFPGCAQVRALGLENRSDREIWEFAKQESFTIATFDADFYDLLTLYGHPPKVIWLRTGNTHTDNLISILLQHADVIRSFHTDGAFAEIGCLEIA
jgi:predicted nuclease of predicted toxin-antitoxin system